VISYNKVSALGTSQFFPHDFICSIFGTVVISGVIVFPLWLMNSY